MRKASAGYGLAATGSGAGGRFLRWCLGAVLATAACSALALTEVEPNNTCATAQNVGTLANGSSMSISGAVSTPPATPDVDFFKVSATPGTILRAFASGPSDGTDTLLLPMVEMLTSSCTILLGGNASDPAGGTVTVPADGVVVIGVSSCCDFSFIGAGLLSGSYTLALTDVVPAKSVTGRVVDAGTGLPLQGMQVTMSFCLDPACVATNTAGFAFSDASGQYSFTTNQFNAPLDPGNYRVTATDIAGRYAQAQSAIFPVAAGEAKVAPDLDMTPTPTTPYISARLLDTVTHAPLSGVSAPFAHVSLVGCSGFACTVLDGYADTQGRIRFDRDAAGRAILAGAAYSLVVVAEQYQTVYTTVGPFAAGVGQDLGDILVTSNPIRFNVLQGCSAVPASGGICQYKVQITNGLATGAQGAAWGTVNAMNLGSNVTQSLFQMGDAQEMSLAPAAKLIRSSHIATFQFPIPGSVPVSAFICPTFWFGLDPAPQLNVQGNSINLNACVQRTATGFVPATDAQVRALRKESDEHAARQRAATVPK